MRLFQCGQHSQPQCDQPEGDDEDDKGLGIPDESARQWCMLQCLSAPCALHRGKRTWRWCSDEQLLALVEGASCDAGPSLAETLLGLG